MKKLTIIYLSLITGLQGTVSTFLNNTSKPLEFSFSRKAAYKNLPADIQKSPLHKYKVRFPRPQSSRIVRTIAPDGKFVVEFISDDETLEVNGVPVPTHYFTGNKECVTQLDLIEGTGLAFGKTCKTAPELSHLGENISPEARKALGIESIKNPSASDILGVPPHASQKEIQARYIKLVNTFDPVTSQYPFAVAREILIILDVAYRQLTGQKQVTFKKAPQPGSKKTKDIIAEFEHI